MPCTRRHEHRFCGKHNSWLLVEHVCLPIHNAQACMYVRPASSPARAGLQVQQAVQERSALEKRLQQVERFILKGGAATTSPVGHARAVAHALQWHTFA